MLPKGGLFCFCVAVQHNYRISIGHWLSSNVVCNFMNKTQQLIGLIVFLSSCVKKEIQVPLKTETNNVVHGSGSIDDSTIVDCSVLLEKKDTILSTGDFIKDVKEGNLTKIEWGTNILS